MPHPQFAWAVVGAGPAGIAAVGKLIDNHIDPKSILWVDPHFKVGDLGRHWSQVSSNTRVELFSHFLEKVEAFHFAEVANEFTLSRLPKEDTCLLKHIVEPLQWVSDRLQPQVESRIGVIKSLKLQDRHWTLGSDAEVFHAKNVILATGAVPSSLNYAGVDVMPFETAIDKDLLAANLDSEKTYGVFGSSHSAIIIIRNLIELGAARVINFYRSPCRYAVNMGDWILFDNTGLKGQTASWAHNNIDGRLPKNLQRCVVNEHNMAVYLPECQQVIYAVGFSPRRNVLIDDYDQLDYNPYTGIIAPGLFGLGIGYPELKTDPLGNIESQVGLWKFMVYINKVLPVWLQYSC